MLRAFLPAAPTYCIFPFNLVLILNINNMSVITKH